MERRKYYISCIILCAFLTACSGDKQLDHETSKNEQEMILNQMEELQNKYETLENRSKELEERDNGDWQEPVKGGNSEEVENTLKDVNDESDNDQTIEISKANMNPVIYQNQEKTITILADQCQFNDYIQILHNVHNNSGQNIFVTIADIDIDIDGVKINALTGYTSIDSGTNVIISHTILAEDIQKAGIEEFEEVKCNVNVLDEIQI